MDSSGRPALTILLNMNNSSEVHRLANSIAGLVTAITEIITTKLRATTDAAVQPQPPTPTPVAIYDPILTRQQLAAHFQVSLRTVGAWINKGICRITELADQSGSGSAT